MKKRCFFLAAVLFSILVHSCISFAAEQNKIGDDYLKNNDDAEQALFLADRHKAAGIECEGCHKEKPPCKCVPTAVCLCCHEAIQSPGDIDRHKNYPDPHQSHLCWSECNECHHSHKASVNQCAPCHPGEFDYRIP